jgi:NitT/TauT family transport system ATP-binding protein
LWWDSAAKDFRRFRWGRCIRTWQQNRAEGLVASQESAAHFLSLFRLTHRAEAYPAELSGGELARLALARCLSWRPRFAIIDESLSQLDRFTKGIVYEALRKISDEQGTRFLLITHILGDAMALADRCLVFGESPVRILGDFEIDLSFPRKEESPEYLTAQEPLLEVVRRGIL